MRSPSEPEPSDSKEHALLDAVEAGHFAPNERLARSKLLEESEKNMRANVLPELYPRRTRNMQLLFEALRQSYTSFDTDFWLEARLLRLTERYEQCRQLCQSRPMYEWTFDVLQEFVWAGRGECYPHERRSDFPSDEDRSMASQLYTAAKTLHDAKCYQWQQAHDQQAKPTAKETRVSSLSDIGFVGVFAAAIIVWIMHAGWSAIIVFLLGSIGVMAFIGDDKDMLGKRMKEWLGEHPKPSGMRLKLEHEPLPRVHIAYDFTQPP
jgi:hypothetical protein